MYALIMLLKEYLTIVRSDFDGASSYYDSELARYQAAEARRKEDEDFGPCTGQRTAPNFDKVKVKIDILKKWLEIEKYVLGVALDNRGADTPEFNKEIRNLARWNTENREREYHRVMREWVSKKAIENYDASLKLTVRNPIKEDYYLTAKEALDKARELQVFIEDKFLVLAFG